ncbi:N-acetylmuramoyl-L-alanine amidase family protein [Prevotella sp.]|uniref:N-acetylmuramoyl-L-alanine amidase family protein n=1 Tax=uncultured Prevotella sp. TaxID=159272 RepID=UPI0025CE0A1A|nr:N-acetylmuramoyl-L-alanine amidase [Prevotella sp.]MCI6130060.1 N-acetylmuramoyl-L-alanine amidase [Prevotella sp.]MCI7372247.1 N-acetylmuramoyl-L-alanine amidase [Prevotella sp.]
MAKKLLLFIFLIISLVSSAADANRKFTLCIDPGHGGKDTGAPGSKSVEKDINLSVALAFGRYVERNCPDVTVVYTRKTDVFIPLYERAEIANRKKADLFISVHTNALKGNHSMRGFETYTLGDGRSHAKKENLEVAKRENSVILLEKDYQQHYVGFDPNSPESNIMFEFIQDKNLTRSIEFAKMLQTHVCRAANRPNKGVHQQNLAVLRLTSMPACLIELGYISTPEEERMLNDKAQVDNMARGIYNAFVQYKNKYDTRMTVPYKTISDPISETPEPVQTTGTDNTDMQASADNPNKDNADNTANPERNPKPSRTNNAEKKPAKTQTVARPTGRIDKTQPVFKVQIIAAQRQLKAGDHNFRGLEGCEFYQENGMVKYTYGASNNYNEIYRLRKAILDKFPGAFIIAFKNGDKMDVNQAIREFKQNRNK